jgi:hypothetical protein
MGSIGERCIGTVRDGAAGVQPTQRDRICRYEPQCTGIARPTPWFRVNRTELVGLMESVERGRNC